MNTVLEDYVLNELLDHNRKMIKDLKSGEIKEFQSEIEEILFSLKKFYLIQEKKIVSDDIFQEYKNLSELSSNLNSEEIKYAEKIISNTINPYLKQRKND